jgi:hypothetical protein
MEDVVYTEMIIFFSMQKISFLYVRNLEYSIFLLKWQATSNTSALAEL